MQKIIAFEIIKGPKYTKEFVKEETDLTAEMIARYRQEILSSRS